VLGDQVTSGARRSASDATPLLEVRDLRKHFKVQGDTPLSLRRPVVRAVDGVSFQIEGGSSLGLVGESGCGKSTIARLVLGLERPTTGDVLFKGRSLIEMNASERQAFRRSVSAVFQDPWGSLNPWIRVGQIVAEPIEINEKASQREIGSRVGELLEDVGLQAKAANQYPHELSGGQRQRVCIARALALKPDLVVLDEPVSSLDVSIRAQVMNLLRDLQQRRSLSFLLIAHHLATVKFLCHSVAVVYLGRIVEYGLSRDVVSAPGHPYMQALFAASLPLEPGTPVSGPVLEGEVPSPITPPTGCHFHTRCPYVMPRCSAEVPPLYGSNHRVRCFLAEEDK
jgi:peptide/nickel transport system ATP-binding protein/oligopeptide transport system ATP-binding protein